MPLRLSLLGLATLSVWAQSTVLVNGTGDGSFEAATFCAANGTVNGWTIVNGSQTNRWAVNTSAGAVHGSRAIYITNNCGATPPPHSYTTNSSSVVHFYRNVTLPAGQPYLTLTASIKVQGEGTFTQYDYLDIFIAPTSVSPTAGTEVDPTYRVRRYNLQGTNWVSIGPIYFCGTAGQSYRVIFSWRNDGSVGTQPPAAVDQVHIVASATPPPASPPPGPIIPVPALPYAHGSGTTCGQGNDLTSSNMPVCGSSSYYGGEDMLWRFTPTTSGTVQIDLTSSTTWTGLMLYEDFCGSLRCVAQAQSSSGDKTLCASVTAGRTYYLQLDYFPSPSCGPFGNLTIDMLSPSTYLCSAPIFTNFPTITSGTTVGASFLGIQPSCASGCGLTGRWYSFVASSSNMTVHVAPGTLSDPAVAVYSAPSCSGPFTQIACNDDATGGCESFPEYARVSLTGLVVGQTYYVAVFAGSSGGSGDYVLGIWETAGQPPSQYGQDCGALPGNPASGPLPVCSPTFSVGAPGFLGSGFTCDLPYPAGGCPASCLASGERNIVWLRLPIDNNGNLSFAIQPSINVDYDWILYRIDNVANPCQAIRNGTLNPVRCSYDAPTSCDGTYGTGVACGTPGCASGTCEGAIGQGWLSCLPVSTGEVYLLGISNFSTSTFPGFSLNFGSSPIDYTASGVRVWTGGAGTTAWNSNANWGNCVYPNSCLQDVVIYGGPTNQPVILAAQTWTVRDISIAAGAKLTVNGTLNVCGHLTCNGELDGTGWIVFNGGTAYPVQEIRGSLAGAIPTTAPYIPNLRVDRSAAGTVRLMTNVQVRTHVEIVNSANNTLDLNGRTLLVGGDFRNLGVASTFQHSSGTVVFNGGGAQNYTDPGIDPFYNVVMNQSPAATLTLNNRMDITNQLTLTSGRIVTGPHEVRVTNTAPTAVTPGNVNSYVQGGLRRYIGGAGAYDFPVGTSAYQRANVNFTAAPGVHNLLAWFNGWGSTPPTPPTSTAECGAQYHTCPMLNNGYWTLNAYAADLTTQLATSGTYTMTLYNTNYSTCAGVLQFGVLKRTGAGSWVIQNLGCHANASAANVQRPGMSGFSDFGTGQSTYPLPVYLSRWEGHVRADEAHVLQWEVDLQGTRISGFAIEAGAQPEELVLWRRFGPEAREAVRVNPPFGASFYRLRIFTEEGSELQSPVLELTRKAGEASRGQLEVFPNPTTGQLTVRLLTPSTEPLSLSLYNTLGQRVYAQQVEPKAAGIVEVELSLQALPVGAYLLHVEQAGQIHSHIVRRE